METPTTPKLEDINTIKLRVDVLNNRLDTLQSLVNGDFAQLSKRIDSLEQKVNRTRRQLWELEDK